MTVVSSYVAQVKPGRAEEALALCRQAAKVVERLGGHNVRLLRGQSGETYGALVMSTEYDSEEAWGAGYDALMSDDELISLMSRAESADAPYLTQVVSSATEIPLGKKAAKRGNVMTVTISRPNPGRFEDAIALGTKASRLFAKSGGSSRLFSMGYAGTQTGTLVMTTEFKNMAALGKAGDDFMTDPKGQDVFALVTGTDSPVTLLSQDVFIEVPL